MLVASYTRRKTELEGRFRGAENVRYSVHADTRAWERVQKDRLLIGQRCLALITAASRPRTPQGQENKVSHLAILVTN